MWELRATHFIPNSLSVSCSSWQVEHLETNTIAEVSSCSRKMWAR